MACLGRDQFLECYMVEKLVEKGPLMQHYEWIYEIRRNTKQEKAYILENYCRYFCGTYFVCPLVILIVDLWTDDQSLYSCIR